MNVELKSSPFISISLCISAIVFSCFAIYIDMKYGVECYNLFSRSGALLALAGVILEYRLSVDASIRKEYVPGTSIDMLQLAEYFNPTKHDKHLRPFAHVMVILGTIVWGFGDLLMKTGCIKGVV